VGFEIDAAVRAVIADSHPLRRWDFDGQVRQYLHAIRTVGGPAMVHEAMREIYFATAEKSRSDVQKWPAFLIKLLKQVLRQCQGKPIEEGVLAPAVSTKGLADAPWNAPVDAASMSPLLWLDSGFQ